MSGNAETGGQTEPDPPEYQRLAAEPGCPYGTGGYTFTDVAGRQKALQAVLWAEHEARALELVQTNERVAAAQERMLPANERIAIEQRATAEANERIAIEHRAMAEANERMVIQQHAMWQAQAPQRAELDKVYLDATRTDQDRIVATFSAMFQQTKWAGYMFWITFMLGVFLVLASVAAVFLQPKVNNYLVAAFFGAGALSMLAFFLRDPADKMQRSGGKLVQLQMAMLSNLRESQYWSNYFNSKLAAGKDITAAELSDALGKMRDGVQVIMRQIDESLDDKSTNSARLPLPPNKHDHPAKNPSI